MVLSDSTAVGGRWRGGVGGGASSGLLASKDKIINNVHIITNYVAT